MPDERTLLLLLERAEAERDAARARAQQAEEAAARLARQSEQLAAYREDYRARAPGRDGRGTDVELLRVHRDFMQRLEQAIAQQARQRQAAEAVRDAAHAQRVAEETRVAAVRKLLERRLDAHARAAARAEQRKTDEAALRSAWSSRRSLTQY
jgi:flagellar FliJ protein